MENKDFDGLNDEINSFDREPDIDLSSSDSDVFDLNSFILDEEDEVSVSSSAESDGRKHVRKKKKSFGQFLLKTVLSLFLVFVITGCLVMGAFMVYVFAFVDGTMDEDLNELKLNFTTTIYVQDKSSGEWVEHQRLHGSDNRIWIYYDKKAAVEEAEGYDGIPQDLANAFIAIEDKRFRAHEGVDWKRTFSAFANMFLHVYSSNQGGSTITQQLVKNLTGDSSQKPSRKVREIMRARYLESEYSKDTILECYMNTIAMGNGMYGVEVPSEYYFGKPVSELTIAQCASLAAITKEPERYRPDTHPENNLKRRNTVLAEMLSQGYITQEEYDTAIAEELVVVGDSEVLKESSVNSYFVDALIDDVIAALMEKYDYDQSHASTNFYNGGYQIHCTMDPLVQDSLESVFTDKSYALAGSNDTKMQGSMTVMDYNGHILGLVGGIGEKTDNRGFNRATMAARQPGSTMKPIAAYAPAIENNLITYSSKVDDVKKVYRGNWSPVNWYHSYWGSITVRYALERSVNTIPVYLVDLLTPQASYDFLTQRLGINTLNQNDIDYAPLGMGGTNGGLNTVESAAAYAIFGNKGRYYRPVTFTEIYDQHGNLVLANQPEPQVALSEDSATIMNHLLQNVVYGHNGTGTGAASYLPKFRIYAKTGTSDATNDLWFVGGSPYYVASCWCGFDELQRIRSSGVAMKMWGNVMSKIHKDLPEKTFEDSAYVDCRPFCSQTGLIATSSCPVSEYGWYKQSGQKTCTAHRGTALKPMTEEEAKKYVAGRNAPPEETTDGDGGEVQTPAQTQAPATPSTTESTAPETPAEITTPEPQTDTDETTTE